MNSIQIFQYEAQQVRTEFDQDGNIWWVASDVCEILEINKSQTRRLDPDEKGLRSMQTPGGTQKILFVNEPGLYSLTLASKKAEAKKFKRWITHDVIPSIRKSGSYSNWIEARKESKVVRKLTTDIIKTFIDYAKSQGSSQAEMYYSNFSKMVNSSLLEIEGEKPKNLRDHLNVIQLHSISVAETIISKSIVECMAKGLPYKEVYQIAKQKISAYAETVGRTKLGSTDRQCVGLLA